MNPWAQAQVLKVMDMGGIASRLSLGIASNFSPVAPNLPCLGCKKGTMTRNCYIAHHTLDDHGDDDNNDNNHSNSNISQ